MALNDMLSTGEAAKFLNVHANTLRTWIKDGSLPAYRIGRNWRYKRADLLRKLGKSREALALEAILELPENATLADAQAIAAAALNEGE